jgi:predicted transcriptional regulator
MSMCKMLLSINPEHVDNIMSGIKKYEFRKVLCKAGVDKIVIYSTSPIMRVVGEAEVLGVIVDSPNKVWQLTAEFSGITKGFFDSYFQSKEKAVAYKLGKVKRYKKPLTLADIGISFAPQSFIYI